MPDLSALSQTCKAVRIPAERELYRHVRLYMSGWIRPKDRGFFDEAGSLRHILYSLERRKELGNYIKNVVIYWDGDLLNKCSPDTISEAEQGLVRFLELCPQLQKLLLPALPPLKVIESFPRSDITSFGTYGDTDELQRVLPKYPKLTDVTVGLITRSVAPLELLPGLNLTRLRVDCVAAVECIVLRHALQLSTVTHLHIAVGKEWDDYEHDDTTPLPAKYFESSTLKSLHLHNFGEVLQSHSYITTHIQSLPLQHLHIEGDFSPTPEGWAALPKTLRSLTVSNFPVDSLSYEEETSITALVECLSSPDVRLSGIQRVEVVGWFWGHEDAVDNSQVIAPLQTFCQGKGIPFSMSLREKIVLNMPSFLCYPQYVEACITFYCKCDSKVVILFSLITFFSS